MRLKTISARVSAKGASLVIEATEPVAYVATRPDPLTVLLDFRNVGADGVDERRRGGRHEPDCRRHGRARRIARRSRLARPRHAVAAGRAPRAQRSQHDRHRLRQARPATAAPYVMPPAAPCQTARARRDDGARRSRAQPVGPDCRARAALPAPGGPRRGGRRSLARRPRTRQARRSRPEPRSRPAPPSAGAGSSRGNPDQPRFPGRRPARRAADVRRNQRPQHRHRSHGAGHRRRRAARRAVGSGARHHPAREQARLLGGRHHRAHRAAHRARRRGDAQAQADRRAGAAGELQRADSAAQLREGRGPRAAAQDGQRAVEARHSARSTSGPTRSSSRDLARPFLDDRRDLIDTLDRAQPQVEIEARIVQTNKNYARALGVQWGFNGQRRPDARQHDAAGVPEQRQPRRPYRRAPRRRRRGGAQPTAVNLPASARDERRRPRARLDQRRVQPRRRAERRSRAPATAASCRRRASRRRTTSRPR